MSLILKWMQKILVSSCLLGNPVRYNGTDARPAGTLLDQWVGEGRVISFCPELAAGFAVPRAPAEIVHGTGLDVFNGKADVLDCNGDILTSAYISGAQQALALAQKHSIGIAVLTDGSPSCGSSYIFDGSFSGAKRQGGLGVTAALLRRHRIEVFSQYELHAVAARLSDMGLGLSTETTHGNVG